MDGESKGLFSNTSGAIADLPDGAPPEPEDWRIVTVVWGGNVLKGSLVSLELPEFDTLSLTLEDLDFSATAFSGAALPVIPDGDSP